MIFDYIETFYNPITRVGDTAGLGYRSPARSLNTTGSARSARVVLG